MTMDEKIQAWLQLLLCHVRRQGTSLLGTLSLSLGVPVRQANPLTIPL